MPVRSDFSSRDVGLWHDPERFRRRIKPVGYRGYKRRAIHGLGASVPCPSLMRWTAPHKASRFLGCAHSAATQHSPAGKLLPISQVRSQ
jgi:hypothetical protein